MPLVRRKSIFNIPKKQTHRLDSRGKSGRTQQHCAAQEFDRTISTSENEKRMVQRNEETVDASNRRRKKSIGRIEGKSNIQRFCLRHT